MLIEARAEGIATIDPTGRLAGAKFPKTGTEGPAALLLLDEVAGRGEVPWSEVISTVERLADHHAGSSPEKLARRVVDLLVEVRLTDWVPSDDASPALRCCRRRSASRLWPRRKNRSGD